MRRLGPAIIGLAVLVAAIITVVAVSRIRQRGPAVPRNPRSALPTPQPTGKGEVRGLDFVQRDVQGNILWRLRSEGTVQTDLQGQAASATAVRWEFYQQGKPGVILQAPQFVGDYPGQRLQFAQGVRIATADGQAAFGADRATYQADTGKLVLERVRFYRGKYTFTGGRAVLDLAQGRRRLRISGGVRFFRS